MSFEEAWGFFKGLEDLAAGVVELAPPSRSSLARW